MNNFLDMPMGMVVLLAYFLVATLGFTLAWMWHYQEYYPPLNQTAGMLGRMNVYMIAVTGFLGTRRVTWSWWILRTSYERALRAHYYVGYASARPPRPHAAVLRCVTRSPGAVPRLQRAYISASTAAGVRAGVL